MNKWWQILWGSREEEELSKKVARNTDGSPDPDELTIENAYKTRWIWYHTILGIELFVIIVLLTAILVVLAVK